MKKNHTAPKESFDLRTEAVGNYGKPPLTDQIPPAFRATPLDPAPLPPDRHGESCGIGEADVKRLREFDIENKK